MVGTLDADHLRRRDGRVILHVLRQLELGRGGPDNQNGVDCVELPYDLSEEPMGVIRMLPWLTAPFRMTVEVVLGRQNRSFIGRIRVDMKHASFVMINPDHGMCRHDGSSVGFSVDS
jgi:hypothetical protein